SEAVRRSAGSAFAFRLVDVVAVKGKTQGVAVHELLGSAGAPRVTGEVVRAYEEAFAAYRERRFEQALARLAAMAEDGPSRVLGARCRAFLEEPPPPDWNGTYT